MKKKMQPLNLSPLKPAMSIHAKIISVLYLKAGDSISYDINNKLKHDAIICTIPVGYADGLRSNLSNKIHVIYNDNKFSQFGKICMNQCMFKIDLRTTDLLNAKSENDNNQQSKALSHNAEFQPKIGDEVIVVGSSFSHSITMEQLAKVANIAASELVPSFGLSLPTKYV